MTGNGDAQRLEKLEVAITGAQPAATTGPSVGTAGGDFLSGMTSILDWGRKIADALGDTGSYDREETEAFLRSLETQAQQWASELLKRKRRDLANLEKAVGKLAG